MHKIIALWAIPRSTSIAFEWMMRQRGDLDCLHEPFGNASRHGEEPMWPRFLEGGETILGLSLESVWQTYGALPERSRSSSKIFQTISIICGDEEAAKHPPLVREQDGVVTQYCREGAAFDGPASEMEALHGAAEAEFSRSLPQLGAARFTPIWQSRPV